MRKSKIISIHLIFALFILQSTSALSQISEIENQPEEFTYQEILDKAEAHFDVVGRGKGTGYKQFLREKTILDGRVNPGEKLRNFSLLNTKAYKKRMKNHSASRSHHGDWTNVGPFDYNSFDSFSSNSLGRVTCIGFHPSNTNIMWVGTPAGGLWKTTDAGQNWTPLTDGFASIGIADIAINYNNPNIMYILTGEARAAVTVHSYCTGVLKTTDGGNTWKETDLKYDVSQLKRGYKMIIHPANPEILYVGMRGDGLFMTTDGGNNFSNIPSLGSSFIMDLEFKPNDHSQMLAATANGLWRSTSSGLSWTQDNDPMFPTNFSGMNIAVSPSQPDNVYAVFNGGNLPNGTFNGCFKSTNFGSTFNPQSTTPNIYGSAPDGGDSGDQGARDLTLIVDPTNDNRIFTGGVNIWKSDDAGVNWGRETYWTRSFAPFDPFVHADQQNLYWHNGELYAVNDGGIYKTADLGNSWTDLTKGLATGQFYEINTHDGSYIGGLQDNGTMGTSLTNTTANAIWGGDGFGCTWHPTNTSIQFVSTQSTVVRKQDGVHYTIWDPGGGALVLWENELEMYDFDVGYLYVDMGSQLWRGNQNTFPWIFNWYDLGTGSMLSAQVRGFARAEANPEVMYVISLNEIIRTDNLTDANPTWVAKTNAAPGPVGMYQIEIDPDNEDRLWVVCNSYEDGEKVYYSDDGAMTWENISGSIANVPMRCIAYDNTPGSEGMYVGTEIGVYYRGENMTDWVPFGNHLPNTIVTDIEILGNEVVVGTFGRGVWKASKFSACPTQLILTVANDPTLNQTGTQFHSAGNNIVSFRNYDGNPGTQVTYSAGSHTDLSPGFEVKAGAFFEAKVGPCQN
jgi:photosystem II stability/assembly factor-like uncharacterized protein